MKLKFWQTRSWSPILPPIKKLESLTDIFLITNTLTINEADIEDRFLITNNTSTEETEEFDTSPILHWSPILPSIEEAEEFDRDHQYSL